MTEALDGFEGSVSIGGRTVTSLRFVDDIDLVAGQAKELGALTSRLEGSVKQLGMQISVEKSKVMRMGSSDELDVSIDWRESRNFYSIQIPRSSVPSQRMQDRCKKLRSGLLLQHHHFQSF